MKSCLSIVLSLAFFTQPSFARLTPPEDVDSAASGNQVLAAGCPETLSVDSYMRCLEREYGAGRLRLSEWRMIIKTTPRLASVDDCWREIDENKFMDCWNIGGALQLTEAAPAGATTPHTQEGDSAVAF